MTWKALEGVHVPFSAINGRLWVALLKYKLNSSRWSSLSFLWVTTCYNKLPWPAAEAGETLCLPSCLYHFVSYHLFMPNSVPKREKRRLNLGNAKKKGNVWKWEKKQQQEKERVTFNLTSLLIELSHTRYCLGKHDISNISENQHWTDEGTASKVEKLGRTYSQLSRSGWWLLWNLL